MARKAAAVLGRKLGEPESDDPFIALIKKALKMPDTPYMRDVAKKIGYAETSLGDFYHGRSKQIPVIKQIRLCLLVGMTSDETINFVLKYEKKKPVYSRIKKSDLLAQGMSQEQADEYMKKYFKVAERKRKTPAK